MRQLEAVPAEGIPAGQRLEASQLAAAALHAALAHRYVADVPGATLCAAVQKAPGDETGTDPGADLDEYDVPVARSQATSELSESHHVHIVVHPDGCVVAGGEERPHVEAVPAGHNRR